MNPVAACVQWVAAGYSGLHDAFDRTGLCEKACGEKVIKVPFASQLTE